MDLLVENLPNIRVPAIGDKIFKDECVYSYDTPESEDGLFVCMRTFLGFSAKYVNLNYEKTRSRVYLKLKRIKIHEPSETGDGEQPKKITKLAIGLEGGYNPGGAGKVSYHEQNEIVILPEYERIPLPNENLPEKVLACVSSILASDSAFLSEEINSLSGTWDGEKRQITKHAYNLPQLENGVKVKPEGWKCEKCDLKDNLWLNLTDGAILCGRGFFDGSGGNNHAVQHYEQFKYPLAVKLGTITFTEEKVSADVYSYDEDSMVEDPLLHNHLAHFGIDVKALRKTEKTMLELELDYNQRIGEWAIIQESDAKLTPITGPGFTGMVNLGNSCYLNSVMQVIFTIPDFQHKYHDRNIFCESPCDPTNDFTTQMAKLSHGLLSGEYSIPLQPGNDNCIEQVGIKPTMFKNLIGRGHCEFSTKRQQDAHEYFLHLVNLIERHQTGNGSSLNPLDSLKFEIEERIECNQSHKVSYTTRSEYILSLQIPLHKALNKEEVAAYEEKKKNADKDEKIDLVRYIVPLEACYDSLIEPEIIEDFYSTAVNSKTTASKITKLRTFPDYLMLHIKKFELDTNWVPKKLDVSLQIPDEIDISHLRGRGLQEGEELLEDTVAGAAAGGSDQHLHPQQLPQQAPVAEQIIVLDSNHIDSLRECGFSLDAAKRALVRTHNTGVEAALNWLLENSNNPEVNQPFYEDVDIRNTAPKPAIDQFVPDSSALDSLINMGITRERATRALKETNNSVEMAIDWIFSHDESDEGLMQVDAVTVPNVTSYQQSSKPPGSPRPLRDGNEKYKLIAIISHMGTSPMCGHYVSHILKDGHWVIFNDNKVAISQNLPKDLGYLYLYERI
ncbi:ubiquitin carboxyl-terminal hydrolase 5 [Tetranychus urticae]|uniref:Ubiquitin carboxyl-terminal hydrolase n=1 Tax=Tetranychus urticae TaxID=32264 RepID=T1KJZ5_TETUR|nr:ubiquitin carboxyl-terminal hydrolase 5 [Tetranychus urticae]